MPDVVSLVVLAAGLGSRFGGQKQLEPVGPGGEAILDYSVHDAHRAGIDRIVLVVSPGNRDHVEAHVAAGFGAQVEVAYAVQEPPPGRKPWGTGEAVLASRDLVPGPFVVVNGDDLYGRRSLQLVADALRLDSPEHVLVAFPLRETLSSFGGVSRALCSVDADGLLTAIEEVHGIEPGDIGSRFSSDELISANLWGFRRSINRQLEGDFRAFVRDHAEGDAEFYIGTTVSRLLRDPTAPRVRVLRAPDRWLGITYRDDVPALRAAVRQLIEAGEYPERLWT